MVVDLGSPMDLRTGRRGSKEEASLPSSAAFLLLLSGWREGCAQNRAERHLGAEPFIPTADGSYSLQGEGMGRKEVWANNELQEGCCLKARA